MVQRTALRAGPEDPVPPRFVMRFRLDVEGPVRLAQLTFRAEPRREADIGHARNDLRVI